MPSDGEGGDLVELLIDRVGLMRRLDEVAASLTETYRELERPLVMIGVLKGSTPFFADLMRRMPIDVEVDFMSISAYSQGEHSGVVRIVKDLDLDVSDRDVLVVEDIVDTGLTLNYLRRALSQRAPSSLRTVTLLDKPARRIVPVDLEFSCFEVPDVFVIGYGLDFQGLFRNLPEILAVRDLDRLVDEASTLAGRLFSAPSRDDGC